MKRSIFFILLTALVILCAFPFLKGDQKTESTSKISAIEKQQKLKDEVYLNKLLHLEKESNSIARKTEIKIGKLQKVKAKTSVLEKQVITMALDSTTVCDSLKNQVLNYITESKQKDSLCDETIDDLVQLLGKKDSIVDLTKRENRDLKSSLDSVANETGLLEQQVAASNKTINRQRFLNRVCSAGLLLLSGITTTLFIIQK